MVLMQMLSTSSHIEACRQGKRTTTQQAVQYWCVSNIIVCLCMLVQPQAMLDLQAGSHLGLRAVCPKGHWADHEVCDLIALLSGMLQGLHRVGVRRDEQNGTVKAKSHQVLQSSQHNFLHEQCCLKFVKQLPDNITTGKRNGWC